MSTAWGELEQGSMAEREREYLTPGEAARLLNVTPKTVARWADLGWLSCIVTLGGHRRFPREEVEAIKAESREIAPGGHPRRGAAERRGSTSG